MNTGTASPPPGLPWAIYLQLARPAQATAAAADVLAGGLLAYALATPGSVGWLAWILASSMLLYAGGAVLNAGRERERGITILPGLVLLLAGIACAAIINKPCTIVATAIAVNAVLYDFLARQRPLLGPFCMGACRALNFLLGLSLSPPLLENWWPLMLLPFLLASAITAIKLQRWRGDARWTAAGATVLLLGVTCGVLLLGIEREFQLLMALPFIACFVARSWPPFLRAALQPGPEFAGAAAHSGMIALICLNAALAAGFGGLVYGACVLLLQPLSLSLGRRFAPA